MDRHAAAMQRLTEAVLETPGDLGSEVRKAIEAYAAGRTGSEAVPAELLPYLEKVAKHAYKVTDGDVNRLRALGYSEDAIFELTLAAALGAASARLEAGLAAL